MVLDLLRDGLVGALLQAEQADLAGLSLADLLHEPGAACDRVRVALARLAVAHDVIALRAPLSRAVLRDVGLVDPKSTRWRRAYWGWISRSFIAWFLKSNSRSAD